ncbi:MAG: hypothetical protein IJ911_02650 [Salinivirgaceae bacterium]|nr:hypothetical protein [Salinivirgaceae bacterium]
MNYSFSISSRNGDEYRIMLFDADISLLADNVQNSITKQGVDISEIMIDRLSGGESTQPEVLHAITGRIADLFAENENLILYYSCDDINPIPSRNMKSANKELSVQEYRSILFSHIFNSYMDSHQVSGIANTPVIINGEGYTQFMHLIARDRHQAIVDLIKDDVIEGWGK